MPHLRARYATPALVKKLKFSPVVSIQGARQTGKSTLAREILTKKLYVTLDRISTKDFANNNPESFIEEQKLEAHGKTLVIDEAQKAPDLFDQIKYTVDRNKKPGQFLLLGSTEFSKEIKIRESLLGRLSRIRLYPMTLRETLSLPHLNRALTSKIDRSEWIRFMNHGGFPGIFSIRDNTERTQKLDDWISLTCERDVHLFPKLKGDTDLCRKILSALATLDEPSVSNVASYLNSNPRKTATQFEILSQLFVLHRLNAHPLGTGKPLYFLNDPGIATHLGATPLRKTETAIYLELLARKSYLNSFTDEFFYYRTSKGSRVHFLTQSKPKEITAYKILSTEKLDLRELEILVALKRKANQKQISIRAIGLGATAGKLKDRGIELFPCESFF